MESVAELNARKNQPMRLGLDSDLLFCFIAKIRCERMNGWTIRESVDRAAQKVNYLEESKDTDDEILYEEAHKQIGHYRHALTSICSLADEMGISPSIYYGADF
jgi:hypothetical protein